MHFFSVDLNARAVAAMLLWAILIPLVPLLPRLASWPATAAPAAAGDRSFKSGPVQTTADGSAVWVADQHADAIVRIDTARFTASRYSLPDPPRGADRHTPRGLAVTEDGSEVWVACHDSDMVYVLNGSDGRVLHAIELPWGSGPTGVALSPPLSGAQRWALVTLHRSEDVAAIRADTHELHLLGPVFRAPYGVAFVGPEEAWVGHLFPDGEHSRVSRIDLAGPKPSVGSQLTLFAATPRDSGRLESELPARNIAEGGYVNVRGHLARLPDRLGPAQLWIPAQYHNMHTDVVTPDTHIQASLRKLDLETRKVLTGDKIHLTARQVHDPTRGDDSPPWLGHGWDAAFSGPVDIGFAAIAEESFALVLGEQSGSLLLVPWSATSVRSVTDPDASGTPGLASVRVGERPLGLAVSPKRAEAYVYAALTSEVVVVDLADPDRPAVSRRIALGSPVADDPVADPVRNLGARVFFGSSDPRVSSNGKVSCASCHINGEHDGRTWNFARLPPGTAGQKHGPRNVQSLLGLGLTMTTGGRDPVRGWGQLHHSGDRDEVQDFEHTFTGPQMGGTGFLGGAVNAELGPPNAGLSPELDALADYLLSVPPLMRSPRRSPTGALSESAVRGATFFLGDGAEPRSGDAACASCHVPESAFTDRRFHDVGQRRSPEERELNDPALRGDCLWCSNTPSLLGLWATAEYDGLSKWAPTMIGVLEDFRASDRPAPHGRAHRLNGRQIADLAEFVLSIDGDLDAATVRGARDGTPPRIVRVAPTSASRVEVWFSEAVERSSAERAAHYRITEQATGVSVPIVRADWEEQNGDRVTLWTDLVAKPGGNRYILEPAGAIADAAADATGGTANPIDPSDPANRHTFVLDEQLTITLGASGYENISIRVHDSSPTGPNLATWNHDRISLYKPSDRLNPGFVRFDWREAFVEATGVADASQIEAAAFSFEPMSGDVNEIEARRVLQGWSDPRSGGDWNRAATGAPTWRDHAHPDDRWNIPGAGALGGAGDSPTDYDGEFDLAAVVDAESVMPAINRRVSFGSPRIRDAYRLWFDNPDIDYGHALRLVPRPGRETVVQAHRWEDDSHSSGPILELTYRLTPATSTPGPGRTLTPTRTPTPDGIDPTPSPTGFWRPWRAHLPVSLRGMADR